LNNVGNQTVDGPSLLFSLLKSMANQLSGYRHS